MFFGGNCVSVERFIFKSKQESLRTFSLNYKKKRFGKKGTKTVTEKY